MVVENPHMPLRPSPPPSTRRGLSAASRLAIALLGPTLLALLSARCGHDDADREYFTALDGEEKGMTREEQLMHVERAVHLAPDRAYLYDTRAGYLIDLKQFDRARQDLDRSIEL